MKVIVLGATGATGREVVGQALAAGHHVVAVVRSPSKITVSDSRLRVDVGDVTDAMFLATVMERDDAVISTLGSMGATLMTEATDAIIQAAGTTGLRRVVMLSSFAVERDRLSRLTRLMTGVMMKRSIVDKTRAESALRRSDLDWTIVYATVLTNGARSEGAHVVPGSETLGMKRKIARADVAAWLIRELDPDADTKRAVTISG